MRVRESNNVLQAVQMNQTLFIKLGNKRNVLGCLADFIKHRLRHGVQMSKTCFIKQCWMMFYGDILLVWTDRILNRFEKTMATARHDDFWIN